MDNLKGISVRIDPRDLNALDEIVKDERWIKRSDLIQAGIRLYLAAHEKGLGGDARHFAPRCGDVVDEFTFKYHRQHR